MRLLFKIRIEGIEIRRHTRGFPLYIQTMCAKVLFDKKAPHDSI